MIGLDILDTREREKENMEDQYVLNSAEPWLCEPTRELYGNVLGFINFLSNKLQGMQIKFGINEVEGGVENEQEKLERIEIMTRLEQLVAWRDIVGGIFDDMEMNNVNDVDVNDLRKKVLRRSCSMGVNYIDNVDLSHIIKMPDVIVTQLSELGVSSSKPSFVRILTTRNLSAQVVFKNSNFVSGEKLEARHDSESKIDYGEIEPEVNCSEFEEKFESNFDTDMSVSVRVRFGNPSQSNHLSEELVTVKHGYVFDKLLRSVDKDNENREIFTAVKCEILQTAYGRQIKLIPNAEKVIVKRVGKFLTDSNGNGDCETKMGDMLQPDFVNDVFRREFKAQYLLSKLKHPNINELLEYFEDDKNIYSVSKSAGSRDLMDLLSGYVSKYGCGFNEDFVKKLLLDAANGLIVAHNLGIAHRDVSLENMVVNDFHQRKGKNVKEMLLDAVVQIIDWGHCVGVGMRSDYSYKRSNYDGPIGKVRYMSPELLLLAKEREEQGISNMKYDPFKADVFAFGVCLFSMVTGQMPFEMVLDKRGQILKQGGEKPATTMVNYLRSRKMHINASSESLDLMDMCLRWDPNARATMRQVICHPFFRF